MCAVMPIFSIPVPVSIAINRTAAIGWLGARSGLEMAGALMLRPGIVRGICGNHALFDNFLIIKSRFIIRAAEGITPQVLGFYLGQIEAFQV